MLRHDWSRRVRRFSLGVVVVAQTTARASAQSASVLATPLDPISAIVEAFRTHDLVAVGEGAHGNEQGHHLRLALIRDDRFVGAVNDIVLECGNGRYQDVMDRFVSGADVPQDLLRHAWQDTTQPQGPCDLPIYEEFVRAVRAVNQPLSPGRQLRILLGDSPIEWSAIHRAEDLAKWISFSDRGGFAADVIQREVLVKKRRALIVYGAMHLQRRNVLSNYAMTEASAQTMVSLLERTARVFTIWTNTDIDLQTAQPDIARWPQPSLAMLRGSLLGAKDFTFYLARPAVRIGLKDGKPAPVPRDQWHSLTMEQQFDALLYLAPPSSITMSRLSPARCADPGYVAMRVSRMSLLPFPPGPANPIERLKQYCATVRPKQ